MPGPQQRQMEEFDLERPLLYFSRNDPWRIRDAVEGTQVFGATGSGKSSGSGRTIAKAFLAAGFGGLVLTAKPDECAMWQRYAKETEREDKLIVFRPGGRWAFNFMNYEFSRVGAGGGLTENLVNLFANVMENAAQNKSKAGNDPYWELAVKQLIRNGIELLAIAKGRVSLPDLYELLVSAPLSPEQVYDEGWQESSFCHECVAAGDGRVTKAQRINFDLAARYWFSEFPSLVDKTRSVIVSMFTGMADCFIREPLRSMFCGETTLIPEFTHKGVVIILDLPVKEYNDLGRFSQILFKYVWQRATERRDTKLNPRPVFLWADESQNFITSYDAQFQTTARSSRACTVFLSQNISNYYAFLSGGGEKSHTDSLLGNLSTKIFHANGDSVTNQWASEIIGKTIQKRRSSSFSRGREGKDQGTSGAGTNEQVDYEIQPREFTLLAKGGPENRCNVEGVVFQNGRVWRATGTTFIKPYFGQND